MISFEDYINKCMMTEGIRDWPIINRFFKKKPKPTNSIPFNSDPTEEAGVKEFKHAMEKIQYLLGTKDLHKDLSQAPEVRSTVLNNPSILDDVDNLIKIATRNATGIEFHHALPFIYRKKQELSNLRTQIDKFTSNKGFRAFDPVQREPQYPTPDTNRLLNISGKQLYVIKAARHGVPEDEIINTLMRDWGVKTPNAAKSLIARIQNRQSLT